MDTNIPVVADSLTTLRSGIVSSSQLDSLSRVAAERQAQRMAATRASERPTGVRKPPVPRYDSLFPYSAPPLRPVWQPFLSPTPAALNIPDTIAHRIAPPELPSGSLFEAGEAAIPYSVAGQTLDSATIHAPRTQYRLEGRPAVTSLVAISAIAVLLILLRLYAWPRFLANCRAVFRGQALARIDADSSTQQKGFYLIADLLYIVTLALFLWRGLSTSGLELHVPLIANSSFLFMLVVLVGRYALQYLVLLSGCTLLNAPANAQMLWRHRQLLPRVYWMPLVILAVSATYAPPAFQPSALYAGYVLLPLVLIYICGRVAVTFSRLKLRPFYYFLYLCALELAPILLVAKWINIL